MQEAYARQEQENYTWEQLQQSQMGCNNPKGANGTFKYEMGQVEEKDGYYSTGIHLVGGGQGARLIFTSWSSKMK